MHAFLIISNSSELARQKAIEISSARGETLMDFVLQNVADSKSLIGFSNLTISKTALFIENIHNATIESTNAFLKTLEENSNLTFILTAKNESSLISTILSRCQIIRLKETNKNISVKANEFLSMDEQERLSFLKEIKNREEAVDFLTELITSLNNTLTDAKDLGSIANIIKRAEKTKNAINANGNTTLQLANFAINI